MIELCNYNNTLDIVWWLILYINLSKIKSVNPE